MIKIVHRTQCAIAWGMLYKTMADHHLDYLTPEPSRILFMHFSPCGVCAARYERLKSTMTGRIYRTVVQDEMNSMLEDGRND